MKRDLLLSSIIAVLGWLLLEKVVQTVFADFAIGAICSVILAIPLSLWWGGYSAKARRRK